MITAELAGILLYIVIQILIGAFIYKRIASESDYFVAGRKLGPALVVFSVFATWFGAETCVGSAGEVYAHGLSGSRADPFGYALCMLLAGLLLAGPLWRKKLITLSDVFRERYGVAVERLASLIIIPTSLIWASAQVRAFGQILSASSQLEVNTAIALAATVVTIYTVLGGLLADAITDIIQGSVLIVGLIIMMIGTINLLGGWGAAIDSIPSERLSLIPSEGETWWMQLDTWMIPILGSLPSQELAARMMAARSEKVAKRGTLTAVLVYLLIGSIPIFLGLVGPAIMTNLSDHEQFLTTLARNYFPQVMFVVFSGAIVSAILSTVDSTLLAISSLISHNLLRGTRFAKDEKSKVKLARVWVVIASISAFFIAVGGTGVYDLVELASSFGSAGVLVILLFGLYSKLGSKLAALAALLAGMGTFLVTSFVITIDAPYILSVIMALAAYLIGSMAEKYV
jgi:SSS family transporter